MIECLTYLTQILSAYMAWVILMFCKYEKRIDVWDYEWFVGHALHRKTEKKEVNATVLGKARVRFWERKTEVDFLAVAASSTIVANRCRNFLHIRKP